MIWPLTRTFKGRLFFSNSQAYNPPKVCNRILMQVCLTRSWGILGLE